MIVSLIFVKSFIQNFGNPTQDDIAEFEVKQNITYEFGLLNCRYIYWANACKYVCVSK